METDMNVKVLDRIREYKDMKKDEFAITELGVNYRTYQRWVAGDTKPSNSNKDKIDKYLKDHKDLMESAAAEVKAEANFKAAGTVLVQKPVWPTLPKETWEDLEDKDQKELINKVEDTLKELAEREEVEA